jgi:hypothetical protein
MPKFEEYTESNEDSFEDTIFAVYQKPITIKEVKDQAIKYNVDMNTVAFVVWLQMKNSSTVKLDELVEYFNK